MFCKETCILDGSGGFAHAKHDLIAELKMSHDVGGVSKLRSEQQKAADEAEKAKFQRFLATFTQENYLDKVKIGKKGR